MTTLPSPCHYHTFLLILFIFIFHALTKWSIVLSDVTPWPSWGYLLNNVGGHEVCSLNYGAVMKSNSGAFKTHSANPTDKRVYLCYNLWNTAMLRSNLDIVLNNELITYRRRWYCPNVNNIACVTFTEECRFYIFCRRKQYRRVC